MTQRIMRAGAPNTVLALACANPGRFVLLRAGGETFFAVVHLPADTRAPSRVRTFYDRVHPYEPLEVLPESMFMICHNRFVLANRWGDRMLITLDTSTRAANMASAELRSTHARRRSWNRSLGSRRQARTALGAYYRLWRRLRLNITAEVVDQLPSPLGIPAVADPWGVSILNEGRILVSSL